MAEAPENILMKKPNKISLIIPLMVAAIAVIGASSVMEKNIKFVWNHSASVPIGLYRLISKDSIERGDLVLIRPPEMLSLFLSEGRYLAADTLLLKSIAALPGQTVCRDGNTISIDHLPIGTASAADGMGRLLPVWQGCITLSPDQIFAMNSDVPDSLDGRYFGALPRSSIIGYAAPILTAEATKQ